MSDEQPSAAENTALQRLVEQAGIGRACRLDLMVFFGRHPRTLLSGESLAAFIGYDIDEVAQSIEDLLAAGVIRRRGDPPPADHGACHPPL